MDSVGDCIVDLWLLELVTHFLYERLLGNETRTVTGDKYLSSQSQECQQVDLVLNVPKVILLVLGVLLHFVLKVTSLLDDGPVGIMKQSMESLLVRCLPT